MLAYDKNSARKQNILFNSRLRMPMKGHKFLLVTLHLLVFYTPLTSMAGDLSGNKPVRSLLEIRYQHVVPQKWDISCGAAALATVMNYQHGEKLTEKEVAEAMLKKTDPGRVKARLGFSLLDMKQYADRRGYLAEGYSQLQLTDLSEMAPIIVPIRVHDYNHFVIFRGMRDGKVLLADPAFGNRRMSIEAFRKSWLGKLGFVVKRPDGTMPLGVLGIHSQKNNDSRAAIAPSAGI